VVSTQLVEAGVDVDFPVVYRAMAGLESLAQAAGRCNREGALGEQGKKGQFFVFLPETEPPRGLRHHFEIAQVMLAGHPQMDIFRPATFRDYFDRLYGTSSRDAHGIQPLREALRFAATAEAFRMIDDASDTVFVPFGKDGERAIMHFRRLGPSRERLRRLQPFCVQVPPRALSELQAQGAIELLHDTIHVLNSSIHYDAGLGLLVDLDTVPVLTA
jgi:CRISPR-associated endonuclease/helicase Cas3